MEIGEGRGEKKDRKFFKDPPYRKINGKKKKGRGGGP